MFSLEQPVDGPASNNDQEDASQGGHTHNDLSPTDPLSEVAPEPSQPIATPTDNLPTTDITFTQSQTIQHANIKPNSPAM